MKTLLRFKPNQIIRSFLAFFALLGSASTMSSQSVWINEFHYDNAGADVNEFVEVAGVAGTDLSTYTIILYNGSNGASYTTLALSGVIDDEGSGFGAVDFAIAGIQNGSPDGIALVNSSPLEIEFISYEGSFTATDGPANGLTSTDVGVSEASSASETQSLQRTGAGAVPADFFWTGPVDASPGSVNAGQSFNVAPPPPPTSGDPYCIASDDFDSPQNLLSFGTMVDMAFMNIGDFWGPTNAFSGNPIYTPFAVVDDGGNPSCPNYFPNDNQGIIPCDYGNRFFAMTDTENPDNMGPVSAEWRFNISSAVNLTGITIDMGAMGDFESANDNFTWSYSIDGAPFTTIFVMSPDESTDYTYTLDNGTTRTLNDPMTVNGAVLGNDLTTFTAPISGAGSVLTLRLEGMGDGGDEALAWDNITVKGIPAGATVPTMGEWAMFLFAVIMLTFGVVFVYNSQSRMVLSGVGEVAGSTNFRQLPFELNVFKTAVKHAFGLAVAGFAFIFLVWGELVFADLVGMALAIPLVAYLLHVISLFGRK